MNSTFRACTVLLAVLVTALAPAGIASAQTITPPSTAVVGTATNASFANGTATIACTKSTYAFTTPPAGGMASTSTAGTNITYTGCTALGGLLAVTATVGTQATTATVTHFLDAFMTSWEISITKSQLTFNVGAGMCNITIAAGATIKGIYTDGTTSLVESGTAPYTRTGSVLCGPASGNGTLTETYTVTPSMTIT